MIYLREAQQKDLDLLFEWANDPVVRSNSFHSEPIRYEEHILWFNQMMADKSVLQYIMMKDDIPIGQIRLSIEGNEAEIGYSIAPEYRNCGYGRQLLRLIVKEAKNHLEIKRLIAKVKPQNVASNHLFAGEGYSFDYTQYSYDLK